MNTIDAICELLSEKRQFFLEYESTTQEMLTCITEKLEALLAKRSSIITEINNADRRIELAAMQWDKGDLLMSAVKLAGSQNDYPSDIRNVYAASAAVRAVVARLGDIEIQVGIRLRVEQKKILNSIRSTNRGVSAKASKFMSMTENNIYMPKDRGKA